MRKLILIFFICACTLHAQQKKVYSYYMELNSEDKVDVFSKKDGKLFYSGNDSKKKDIFSKYEVLQYSQAFPDARDEKLLKIYVLKTTSSELAPDLMKNCKDTYKLSDDITNNVIQFLEDNNDNSYSENIVKPEQNFNTYYFGYFNDEEKKYYPNDYGNTSPVANFGDNVSRKDLDYLNAPKAWYLTRGNPSIKIGISDTQIGYNLPDLAGKVTFFTPSPPYTSPPNYSHGTIVAAMAAGRGDNTSGSVGVCMECNIVGADMAVADAYTPTTSDIAYSNLYKMAKAGAKVINMSWYSVYYTNSPTGNSIEQLVINDLVNNWRVTLVGAAGNWPSFSTSASYHSSGNPPTAITPFGIIYIYPASYDNVISVSSISWRNPIVLPLSNNSPSYWKTSKWFPVHINLEDSISYNVNASNPLNPLGVERLGDSASVTNPDDLRYNHTLNDKVDILAAGYQVYSYNNPPYNTANGTSLAAPQVSGTIGLMLSINDCLYPAEIESILKLTAKDVEFLAINSFYVGQNLVGAGKLNIGDAVTFTDEMKKVDGNAVIENHIFNRFDFNLSKINNKLIIQNVVFKENCKANFTSRNVIDIPGNSDFNPNSNGFIDLKTDSVLSIGCVPIVFNFRTKNPIKNETTVLNSLIKIYPNPNKGVFTINLGQTPKSDIEVKVYDVSGKLAYSTIGNKIIFEINLPTLPTGVYFVKLQGENYDESIKFIKE